MLRLLVLLLLAANLGYWAWTQTPLRQIWTNRAASPDRLARQVRPEALRLLPSRASAASDTASPAAPDAASAGEAAPAAALACLETESLSPSALAAAQRQLQLAGVEPGGWLEMRRELPGEWMLYMGPFPSRDALERKLAELQPLQVKTTLIVHGGAPWGLHLGVFDSATAAQAGLVQLQGRGVKTARVLILRPPTAELRLRADRLNAAALAQLQGPGAASAAAGADAPRWLTCP